MKQEIATEAEDSKPVKRTIGSVINGRFEVVKVLPSRENRSYVCKRLTAPRQGELAVVKFLAEQALGEHEESAAKRFQHEFVAAMSVKHPNIVRMDETIKEGANFAYIVEYVEGSTLQELLEDRRPTTSQVILFLRQLCSGVQAMHDAGIIHRNLKPKTAMVATNDHLKITDFGLVKIIDQKGITQDGMVLGTVDYLAPEYVMGSKAGFQLDIYALGVIGYEMLTDTVPFHSTNLAQMFHKRATQIPERPDKINKRCTKELAEIILRAVNHDLMMRYQSAKEMLADLEHLPGYENLVIPKAPKPEKL